MKPWYEDSFGHEYLELYAHRDQAEADADIRAIIDLISPDRDQPLLDLCCGAGRHLVTLRDMGFTNLVGLDLSQELLDVAETSLSNGGTPIELVRADMRDIPYENAFSTILSLFTSFGYFEQDEENQAVFDAVYRALRPGGQFLIDYMNRECVIANLVECDERSLPGRQITNVRCLTDDGRRVTKRTSVTFASGEVREYFESVRMYSESELVDMLRRAGLTGVRTFGSLDLEPFGPKSRRLIAVCSKA